MRRLRFGKATTGKRNDQKKHNRYGKVERRRRTTGKPSSRILLLFPIDMHLLFATIMTCKFGLAVVKLLNLDHKSRTTKGSLKKPKIPPC